MVWQDVFSRPAEHVDVEQERELRLAAQAAAGADWALAALVARYQPPVTRYLTRLTGNPVVAQAEAEQIFVRMERRLHGPHGGNNLRLWLLRAATEAGLNILQEPRRQGKPLLAGPGQPIGLLPGQAAGQMGGAVEKLRAGLDTLATLTGTTARQVRKLVWSTPIEDRPASKRSRTPAKEDTREHAEEEQASAGAAGWGASDDALDEQDPRVALRHRLVRAVLAELPYGDAQCLALHLVAGLNQREVARALGITPSAVRRRVVQGLQLFARRYEAAIASLGLSPEMIAEAEPATEAPESDEIMVTGEVAAVSPPLPYAPEDSSMEAMPAEPPHPLAAGAVPGLSAGETPEDLTIMATAPLPHESPQEIIVDAEPPSLITEPLVEAYSPEAGHPVVVASSTRADEPDRPFKVMPAVGIVDVLPAGEPRRVPVLTQPGRSGTWRTEAPTGAPMEDAVSGALRPGAGGAARVIPVLSAREKLQSHNSNGAAPDVENLEPLLADVAQPRDPHGEDEGGPSADRPLASAALTGSGGLSITDSTADV